jgi:hypothetical protein
MPTGVQHLHTYFLFPFSIDREAVLQAHPAVWRKGAQWIDGLDEWIASHPAPFLSWRRSPYTRFDLESPAYQDMVFFHPVVRRVFFDTTGQDGSRESLLHCYTMRPPPDARIWFEGEDAKGRSAAVEVTDLRLFLFANGIGVLSLGVEARNTSVRQALWINEALRKVYPSSARAIREGRAPCRLAMTLESAGARTSLAEERFERCDMSGFLPPLTRTVTSLLYFADYDQQEFEPVLDERMIVYTYAQLDPATLPPGYLDSHEYQVLLSRLLWVEQDGAEFRYEPGFLLPRMQAQLYRRWAHQGTYYGFTSYSSITTAIGAFDCDEHQLREGFLIHRMFNTRYYLMALVALFYRATLLDFAERTALASRRLTGADGRLTPESVRIAEELRADFLQFANYWHFEELANKEEEAEHFRMQCAEYRVPAMKAEIEGEVESLETSVQRHYQARNTEAINRVAMLSLILGAGAVLTGFFGMNFARGFGEVFFNPTGQYPVLHYLAIAVVVLYTLGAVGFGVWVVAANWGDYRKIIDPRGDRRRSAGSLRK